MRDPTIRPTRSGHTGQDAPCENTRRHHRTPVARGRDSWKGSTRPNALAYSWSDSRIAHVGTWQGSRFSRQKSTPGGQGGLVHSDKGAPKLGQLQYMQLEVIVEELSASGGWRIGLSGEGSLPHLALRHRPGVLTKGAVVAVEEFLRLLVTAGPEAQPRDRRRAFDGGGLTSA
jgi:hypothetical protein